MTPDVIARLGEVSGLPVVVKGVLRGDEAVRCVEAGAAGVIVSNHGGRQLDRAVPSALALADVARPRWAVAFRCSSTAGSAAGPMPSSPSRWERTPCSSAVRCCGHWLPGERTVWLLPSGS